MRRTWAVETLEVRELLSFDPTPMEQAFLEDINRTRLNPAGEIGVIFSSTNPLVARDPAVNGAIQYFGVDGNLLLSQWSDLRPAPPLAWNEILMETAADHNVQMQLADVQEHQVPGEASLGDRIRQAGYHFRKATENIYAFTESHIHGHAGFIVDWGSEPGGIQSPPGHRINILDPDVIEVGIDVLADNNALTSVGPYLVTQDFGQPRQTGNPFVLGIVWEDGNFNEIYDPGEGIADADIIVTGSGGTFQTRSMTAGGYQLAVPQGTYQVTASGGSLAHPLVVANLVVTNTNVKADFNTRTGLQPPIALADTVAMQAADSVSIHVLANDRDPDGSLDPTTVTITSTPTYGSVAVDAVTGVVTYRTGPVRAASDTFYYTVRDRTGAISNPARVTVTLAANANQPPVARDISADTDEDLAVGIAYQALVSDAENSLAWSSMEVVSQPTRGSVTIDAQARVFRYSPNKDFFGSDSFTYRIADTAGLISAAATVRVTVAPVNDAPTAANDQFIAAQGPAKSIPVLKNDGDIDDAAGTLAVHWVQRPMHGTVSGQGENLQYQPDAGFVGLETMTYQVVDPSGASSNLATVRLYVTQTGMPWRNPANPLDVDGNDQVSPLDALLVINHLGVRLNGGGLPPSLAGGPTPFLDVVGDNLVTPLDALLIINDLGNSAPGQSRSAMVGQPTSSTVRSPAEPFPVIDTVFAAAAVDTAGPLAVRAKVSPWIEAVVSRRTGRAMRHGARGGPLETSKNTEIPAEKTRVDRAIAPA